MFTRVLEDHSNAGKYHRLLRKKMQTCIFLNRQLCNSRDRQSATKWSSYKCHS
ncbi:unnamed protein product [Tenebrio molitor]|nr:unnamed protein product [Tenebrio molitor]